MRRALPVVAALVILLAAGAQASPRALPRSTADRADEVAGPQIHFVYAIPADGEDRHLDDSGAIEGSVGLFQRWLAEQTGGPNLRVDTYQGSLDVSFAQLDTTDAQMASRGAYVRDGIEEQLRARGFAAPDKIYAVYYDGTSTYACGGAFWPPRLHGNVVAMYLRGLPQAPVPCSSNGLRPPDGPAWYWEFAMLHDILHGLGLVPECAPNHRDAHVPSPNNDLMWTGSEGYWQLPPVLDAGRDDYYGHGRTDCPDLANSPYLTSNEPQAPVAEPAAPTVVSFTVSAARAGRLFTATLRLDTTAQSATCVGRVGAKRLPATKAMSGATARCSWRLPRTARGRRVSGSVTATTAGGFATRTFARRVN